MNSNARLSVNAPKVANQLIDGEVIMINLDTGTYYSLDKVGALVWSLIQQSASLETIIEGISFRYEASREEMLDSVAKLIDDLSAENLIRIDEAAVESNAPRAVDPAPQKQKFEAPSLQKYTDMQDLLLLDPIHEVDEAGWPVSKPEPMV
jgi:hypothetical protein